MPIRKDARFFYPIDWRELSHEIRFRRAGGRCERCGRPHRQWTLQLADGRWQDVCGTWRDDRGRTTMAPGRDEHPVRKWILLGTAHLDHDPGNSRPRNLEALCQRCHLRHDRQDNHRRRRITLLRRRALGDLFEGPYASW